MLRTNLATRPFYNERLVHVLLGVAFALVARKRSTPNERIIGHDAASTATNRARAFQRGRPGLRGRLVQQRVAPHEDGAGPEASGPVLRGPAAAGAGRAARAARARATWTPSPP